ncbi:hypothetical protein Poly21_50480 [Allorhodopirellula heiligendammensis]|uniref:Uncharacterized protein n=1 Tax=Allorhodopirellula heiligendammensis TaxID=2714739 RepID=A0A5C6BHX1_9BACT|nr:hypothetical protein Poly21_50480 [Allorhodopirellula heiligendammensis]
MAGVNLDNGSLRNADGLEYIGLEFDGYSGQTRVSKKSLAKFHETESVVFSRNRGPSMSHVGSFNHLESGC